MKKITSKDIAKRIDSAEIIEKMSPELKKEIGEAAKESGLSMEQFIDQQLTSQLIEDDISISYNAPATQDGASGRVRVGVEGEPVPGGPDRIRGRIEAEFPIRIKLGRGRRGGRGRGGGRRTQSALF